MMLGGKAFLVLPKVCWSIVTDLSIHRRCLKVKFGSEVYTTLDPSFGFCGFSCRTFYGKTSTEDGVFRTLSNIQDRVFCILVFIMSVH